jgi:hypothetical protein
MAKNLTKGFTIFSSLLKMEKEFLSFFFLVDGIYFQFSAK